MKDKFLIPAVFAGLLQAVLLFLNMDIFYWQTIAEPSVLTDILNSGGLWLVPGILGALFGGAYAAPMLLFSQKRNWLYYFLCSIGFFLLFAGLFFAVTYVIPTEVAHMPPEMADVVPNQFDGLVFGLILLVFSIPYLGFAALAKMATHLVFIGIWLVRLIRTRRAASL